MSTSLFLTSLGAQAVTCSGICTITYRNVVGQLSVNASPTQKEDFKANCTQYHRGSLQYIPNGPYEYLCVKGGESKGTITGQGSDILQARTDARQRCSQQASSSGYTYAVGSIYGNMSCN